MGERFAFVTEGEINLLVDKAVSENNIRSKRFSNTQARCYMLRKIFEG